MGNILLLDGPALYTSISVTTTPQEVKVGGSALQERQLISIQPIDGDIYYGYDNSVSSTTGTLIKKGQWFPQEAGEDLSVWVVAASGTVDVRITEVG